MAGIKKWVKVNVLEFDGKFILCSKWLKPCVRTEGPLLLHTFADYVNVQVNLFCFVLFLFLWQFFQVRPYRGEQTRLKHL